MSGQPQEMRYADDLEGLAYLEGVMSRTGRIVGVDGLTDYWRTVIMALIAVAKRYAALPDLVKRGAR